MALDVHMPLNCSSLNFRDEALRALKAGLMYADHLTIAHDDLVPWHWETSWRDHPNDLRELKRAVAHDAVSIVRAVSPSRVSIGEDLRTELRQTKLWRFFRTDSDYRYHSDEQIDDVVRDSAFYVPQGGIPLLWPGAVSIVLIRSATSSPSETGFIRSWMATPFDAEPVRAKTAELRLAGELLAALPTFPEADMADILDVRDRLEPSRARLRAALAEAGPVLAAVPDDEFGAAAAAYREERIDVALADIRESLTDLNAIPTLLRITSDPSSAGLLGSAVLAAMMFDPTTVVTVGAAVTGLSAAARETLVRRSIKRELHRQPYWYLEDASRLLGRAGKQATTDPRADQI